MRIKFVWVGRTRGGSLCELESDYLRRLRHFHPCEVAVAKPCSDGPDSERLVREGREIDSKMKDATYTIALDRAGAQMDSCEFSRFMRRLLDASQREVAFIIGGQLGIDQRVLHSVDHRLSLSKMTFPHELCRVILLEQVYRACSIQSGAPYHK